MKELLTIQNFLTLSNDEREQYILNEMKLEDFWVMGYISNPRDDKAFFFIRKLINPYTTLDLEMNIFQDTNLITNVFCSLPHGEERLKEGTLVAVKVRLNDNSKIKERKVFFTTYKDIYVLEEPSMVMDLLDKTVLDLPIIAITKPTYYERSNSEFDTLTNIIQQQAERERISITDYAEKERATITKQLEALQVEQENLDKERENLQRKREKLLDDSKVVNQKIEELNKLGFSLEASIERIEKSELPKFELPSKQSELIKLVQEQLALRGYYYENRFLRQLLLSLTTGQMIVLMGPSGTGKTTIIKQLADVIDANYEIIPVQPSWTDKQDLLGFYNPIRKLFVPTPFLDCLIKAKNNPDRLYFICLDEMNLAQIEYYLADILSIREVPDEKLRLYSDYEYEQNLSEIRWFVQRVLKSNKPIEETMNDGNIDTMMHFEMVSRYTNMQRYLPQLEIPSNVRIIGTMNVDGAVQAISPKIVDRSFIIPVMKQNKKENVVSQKTIGRYPIHPSALTYETTKTISTLLRSVLNSVQEELAAMNITFNERVENHIQQYYNSADIFEMNTKQQLDDIAIMKLFPRIHNTFDDAQVQNLLAITEAHVGKDSAALDKMKSMQERMAETGLLSYWS